MVTTVVKLCLKSFQEFVRLQTFNRSGFQQIQLDIQFLRTPLKETVEDEAAIDFLLDEVKENSLTMGSEHLTPHNFSFEKLCKYFSKEMKETISDLCLSVSLYLFLSLR